MAYQSFRLEQFNRGKYVEQGAATGEFTITAVSTGLSQKDAELIFESASTGSYNQVGSLARLQHGYNLVQHNQDTYVAVHLRPGPVNDRGHLYPDYHCIVVPKVAIYELNGDIQTLLRLFDSAPKPEPISRGGADLPALNFSPPIFPDHQQAELTEDFFKEFYDNPGAISALISAIASEQSIAIDNAPIEPEIRVSFVQKLMLLFPPAYRPRITFATEVFDGRVCPALIKFLFNGYANPGENDLIWHWGTADFTLPLVQHSYSKLIMMHYLANPGKLVADLDKWNSFYSKFADQQNNTNEALKVVAARINLKIQEDEGTLEPESIASVLTSEPGMNEAEYNELVIWLFDLSLRKNKLGALKLLENRPINPGLMRRLEEKLIWLTSQGFGQVILQVFQDQATAVHYVSDWSKFQKEIDFSHLDYLIRSGNQEQLLAWIKSMESGGVLGAQTSRDRYILTLWPAAQKYRSIAIKLLNLINLYQPEKLINLLSDIIIQSHWSDELKNIVSRLQNRVGSFTTSSTGLSKASQNLGITPDEGQRLLIQLSILAARQNCFDLFDTSTWVALKLVAQNKRNDDYYTKLIATLISTCKIETWVTGLENRDKLEGLLELVFYNGNHATAILLLSRTAHQLDHHNPEKWMGEYLKTKAPILDKQSAEGLARAARSNHQPLDRIELVQIYTQLLRKFNWDIEEAAYGLADLIINNPEFWTELGQERLRLLGGLSRHPKKDEQSMNTKLLQKELDDILYGSRDLITIANNLENLARQIGTNQVDREIIADQLHTFSRELPLKDIKLFFAQIETKHALSAEARAIRPVLQLKEIMNGRSIEEILNSLEIVSFFVEQLQSKSAKTDFDWTSIDAEMKSQFTSLGQPKREIMEKVCNSFAATINNAAERQSKTSFFESTYQLDDQLRQHKRNPKSALDALKWLAGVFSSHS